MLFESTNTTPAVSPGNKTLGTVCATAILSLQIDVLLALTDPPPKKKEKLF